MTSKRDPSLLPEEIVWADGGHASDVSLTAIADGESALVPALVLAHVESCTVCTKHLGNAALLSLHAGRELTALDAIARSESATAAARAPFPRLAVLLGLAVAALGSLPTLLDGGASARGVHAFATHDVPVLVSGLRTLGHRLLDPSSPIGLGLTYAVAALLVVAPLVVVRMLPRKEVTR